MTGMGGCVQHTNALFVLPPPPFSLPDAPWGDILPKFFRASSYPILLECFILVSSVTLF